MEFLAPIMLAGIAAVAIPIAIHLMGRRRARVVEFAALDFLLGSDRKVARKLRLRELLLLAARVLVCLAIPLAFAKPLTSCEAAGPEVERGPQAVVLIVDDSLPTRYELDDATIFAQVARHARAILEQLGPEADVAIVRASEGSPQPGDLSRDHLGLRDTLASLEPTARPPDLTRALSRAAALLEGARHERRTAFLISPLWASGLSGPVSWPEGGPALEVIPVAADAPLENLAIVDLAVEADPSSGERGVRVLATIQNFGSTAKRDQELRLLVGEEVAARGHVSVDPGEVVRHAFLAALPRGERAARVQVSLAGDALAIDDSRHLIAELQEKVDVLLVNGAPSSVRYEDEIFYLRAALRPGDRGETGVEVRSVTVDGLDDVDLADFDTVVLANVPALSAARVSRLAGWVEAGGGLLVTAGDNVDPIEYEQSMDPLLPQGLLSVRDVTYGSSGRERDERALRLAELDVDHPVLGAFSADSPSLTGARFSRLVLLSPTAEVGERRVIARFDSGAPALVEARRGRGRVMMLTSSIDRAWNDLAIYPGYPPLVQAIVRYLGQKQELEDPRSVQVGHAAEVRVQAGETRIVIDHPSGYRQTVEGDALAERRRARAGRIDEPGFYEVLASEGDAPLVRDPERDFAAHIDPRASNLERVDVASIREADGGGERGGTHERRVELWHAIAAALLLFLLIEAVLVWRSS
jgi:hypothetical protein